MRLRPAAVLDDSNSKMAKWCNIHLFHQRYTGITLLDDGLEDISVLKGVSILDNREEDVITVEERSLFAEECSLVDESSFEVGAFEISFVAMPCWLLLLLFLLALSIAELLPLFNLLAPCVDPLVMVLEGDTVDDALDGIFADEDFLDV